MPFFSITLEDDFGRRTRKMVEIVTKPLLADYVTLAAAFAGDLAAVTDLALVRMDLIITGVESPFAGAAGSNVDVGATFTGNLEAGNGKRASLKIPGFPLAKVDDDGSIDLTDADVAAYLAYWVTTTPSEAYLSDGETIEAWVSGSLDK